MRYLKQSTAAVLPMGPFLDKTDGITPEEALSTQAGRIVKNGTGAAFTAGSWAHDADGTYLVGLSTSHTDTLGALRVSIIDEATYCAVWEDFMVLPANVYDSMFSTDKLQVDAVEISSSTTAADNVEANIGNLDAAVSGRSSHAAADTAALVLTTPANKLATGASGEVTTDAASRTASKADVTNLDVAVSTRSSHAAADTAALVLVTPAQKLATGASGEVITDAASRTASKADVSNLDVAVSTRSSHAAADTAALVLVTPAQKLATGAAGEVTTDTASRTASKADVSNLDVAVSTRSAHAAADVVALMEDLSSAEALAACTAALAAIRLNELMSAALASQPAAGSLLGDLTEDDGGDQRFSANALEEAPTGGSAPTAGEIADAVWDETSTGHVDAGKAGAQVWTDIDAILADTDEIQTDIADGGRLDLLVDAIKAKSDGLNFTGDDVKATLDGEEVVTDAASRTASKADVTNLDAAVSTRAPEAGGNVAAIKAKTDNLPADPASETNVDTNETKLDTIAGYLDTEMAAVLAAVDTEVAAIKAVTDTLPRGIKKGVEFSITFTMVDDTDHVTLETGKAGTMTITLSKDGAAFAAATNAVAEIGTTGVYRLTITATEMNADLTTMIASDTGCDDRVIHIPTVS